MFIFENKFKIKLLSLFSILTIYLYFTYTEIIQLIKIKKYRKLSEEKFYVKVISPNFDLEYNLTEKKLKIDLIN